MLHEYVRKFDVTGIMQKNLGTKQGLNDVKQELFSF